MKACDLFLAGAGFTQQQGGGIHAGGPPRPGAGPAESGALANRPRRRGRRGRGAIVEPQCRQLGHRLQPGQIGRGEGSLDRPVHVQEAARASAPGHTITLRRLCRITLRAPRSSRLSSASSTNTPMAPAWPSRVREMDATASLPRVARGTRRSPVGPAMRASRVTRWGWSSVSTASSRATTACSSSRAAARAAAKLPRPRRATGAAGAIAAGQGAGRHLRRDQQGACAVARIGQRHVLARHQEQGIPDSQLVTLGKRRGLVNQIAIQIGAILAAQVLDQDAIAHVDAAVLARHLAVHQLQIRRPPRAPGSGDPKGECVVLVSARTGQAAPAPAPS